MRSMITSTSKEGSWRVVGHEWVTTSLSNHITTQRLNHAYILSGPDSIGKLTLAIDFARAIMCSSDPFCGNCRSCDLISEHKHPDVCMVMPALSGKHIQQNKISVDKIRELIYQFALKPIEADRRVAIIQNLEMAGRQATDALLKTLEEPPGNAVFIITTDNLSDLPETIVSRCVHFALKPLSSAMVKRELISRWGTNDEEASFLSRVSGGRLGWAVMLKQDKEALIDRSTKISGMVALLPKSKVDRFSYVEGIHKDRVQVVSTLAMWQSWWRDVMILASGANNSAISNIDYHNEIQKVASQVDVAKAANTISAIRNTLEALRKNANAKLALEVLMLQIPTVHPDA